MERSKRVKREPVTEPSDEEGARAPKQAASPAQEATRAHIISLETQMRKLCKLSGEGKLDSKGAFQMRCIEEDLRKAHSKLRRLLNEAERQRRRRERLRGGPKSTQPMDDGIMAALKSCTRFQDFVRELNVLGFTLTQNDEQVEIADSNLPEVDGVKVQVELIEGDEEFAPEIKTEYNPASPEVTINETVSNRETDEQDRWRGESYRQWFERQTELQQRWEENFMREQMEMTRSLLESVTSTFLQGVQQVLSNLNTGRRFPPFCPDPPT